MNIYQLTQYLLKLAEDKSNLSEDNKEFLEQELSPEEHDVLEEKSSLISHLDENPFNDIEDLLLSYDIYPIVSNTRTTALIGEGSYNKVFEVTYQGKHAVAKVTESKQDLDMLLKLSELRSEFGDLGKHFPIIYTYFSDQLNNKTIYVIVVEYLWPINSHLKNLLFDQSEFVLENVEELGKLKKEKIQKIKKRFLSLIRDDVLNSILEKIGLEQNFDITQLKKLFQFIYNNLEKIINFVVIDKNQHEEEIYDLDFKKIRRDLFNIISKTTISADKIGTLRKIIENIFTTVFPRFTLSLGQNDQEILSSILPESKSLMECLKKLKTKGILWDDMRSCNIMERPKTRDLVISDPGLFKSIN